MFLQDGANELHIGFDLHDAVVVGVTLVQALLDQRHALRVERALRREVAPPNERRHRQRDERQDVAERDPRIVCGGASSGAPEPLSHVTIERGVVEQPSVRFVQRAYVLGESCFAPKG